MLRVLLITSPDGAALSLSPALGLFCCPDPTGDRWRSGHFFVEKRSQKELRSVAIKPFVALQCFLLNQAWARPSTARERSQ
jgi:hypothetical protein